MTLITQSPRPTSALTDTGRALFRAVQSAASIVGRLVAAEIDRRRLMGLMAAEDHMLRDIGVSRSDVASALLTGAGEKASDRLSEIRTTRRIAERAQAREARRAED